MKTTCTHRLVLVVWILLVSAGAAAGSEVLIGMLPGSEGEPLTIHGVLFPLGTTVPVFVALLQVAASSAMNAGVRPGEAMQP
jgi:hypothetical protein